MQKKNLIWIGLRAGLSYGTVAVACFFAGGVDWSTPTATVEAEAVTDVVCVECLAEAFAVALAQQDLANAQACLDEANQALEECLGLNPNNPQSVPLKTDSKTDALASILE